MKKSNNIALFITAIAIAAILAASIALGSTYTGEETVNEEDAEVNVEDSAGTSENIDTSPLR